MRALMVQQVLEEALNGKENMTIVKVSEKKSILAKAHSVLILRLGKSSAGSFEGEKCNWIWIN